MMDALSVPLFRTLLVGALAAGSIAAVATTQEDPTTRRLSLHAVEERNAFYLSAWGDGDVLVSFPDEGLRAVTFYSRARLSDGCRWTGVEKLTPVGEGAFFYEYSEIVTDCVPGAEPYRKTPRTGLVTLEQ